MLFFSGAIRRAVVGAMGAATTSAAVLLGVAPLAAAQPPPPPPAPAPAPPNCTSADLAGVAAGVGAAASTYLFTHPDVNAYFTSLAGQPRDQIRAQIQNYLDSNPQTQSDLQTIRQPLTDLENRCQ